jgi:hypothetical protein
MTSLYKDEMKRTEPPKKCQHCGDMQEACNPDFQDNRMELYRDFAMVPSDIPGEYVWFCKSCMRSAFSREGLYLITGNGKPRMSWVTESVWCIAGCGKRWRREEKEVVKIPIT